MRIGPEEKGFSVQRGDFGLPKDAASLTKALNERGGQGSFSAPKATKLEFGNNGGLSASGVTPPALIKGVEAPPSAFSTKSVKEVGYGDNSQKTFWQTGGFEAVA